MITRKIKPSNTHTHMVHTHTHDTLTHTANTPETPALSSPPLPLPHRVPAQQQQQPEQREHREVGGEREERGR